jgi:hypothetical protein
MEKWSFQRIRELMTPIALRGMAGNKIGCARISMMVRSMSSNTRPDTLMQDRTLQAYRLLLQRTAGPYIGVKTSNAQNEQVFSGLSSIADIQPQQFQMSLVLPSPAFREGRARWLVAAPLINQAQRAAPDIRRREKTAQKPRRTKLQRCGSP